MAQLSEKGLTLYDTVTLDTAYSNKSGELMPTYFSGYSATSSLWLIVCNNTSSANNALQYATGSYILGVRCFGRARRISDTVDSNYSITVGAGSTLELWTIDYDDLI